MKIAKKRCEFCHEWFSPDPRASYKQRCCQKSVCRKKRKSMTQKNWRLKNHGYERSRREKINNWAKTYPNYWQKYRREHPDYTTRDNQRRVLSRQKASMSAKQDQITQFSLEKLESIKKMRVICSAKQDQINRRINEVVNFLLWKELSAKQNEIAICPSSERQYEYASGNLGRDKTIESG